MRIKICGITQPDQGRAIATCGATALGFILVPSSPRYVKIEQINAIIAAVPDKIDFIGVISKLHQGTLVAFFHGFEVFK